MLMIQLTVGMTMISSTVYIRGDCPVWQRHSCSAKTCSSSSWSKPWQSVKS